MLFKIGVGDLAAMDPGAIPNQDELSGYLSPNMFECGDEFFAIDGTFKMSFVDFAGKRQGHRRGQRSPFFGHSAKDRPLASTRPGGG